MYANYWANTTCLPEITEEAAIYCNPFDVNDIAEKMLLVNSNSIIREDLATKSLQRSKFFDWELAAKKVDAEIKKIVETLPNWYWLRSSTDRIEVS